MIIKNCRSCKSTKLKKLFNLGKLSFTGKFSNKLVTNIPKAELGLIMCKECGLVQLSRNFKKRYLYGPDYGYRTGMNNTMKKHVKSVVNKATKITELKKNEAVLDIASNDGTLLNYYKNSVKKVGIDPTIVKFKKYYRNIDFGISDFFAKSKIEKKIKKKFKVITALSVFYDAEAPNKFLSDVEKLLEDDGIFILEHADLSSIIKLKMFDTICHEHLEYYSHRVIINLLKKNNLELFDFSLNDINGGSTQYYIKKIKSKKYKTNNLKIKKLLKKENSLNLNKVETFKKFFNKIKKIKFDLITILKKLKTNNKIIHGYGASTKGNVLLQYFGIDKKYLDVISDRNPKKNGFYTPNFKIKIVKEEYSRNLKPDYYLVLPWHFKKEILIREKRIRRHGTKFIFPLPKVTVN